jgi:AcrR family transcriptional regulator
LVRPRQFHDEDLLAAARACFIAHGPGVSTTLIAEQAGVSQATLFKRFGTKRDLLVAALTLRSDATLLTLLDQGPTDAPLPVQLEALASALVTQFDRMLPCVMTLWAAGLSPQEVLPAGVESPLVVARRQLVRFFAAAQQQGRLGGAPPASLALQFIGAAKELAFQRHLFPDSAPDLSTSTYARDLVWSFWAGCQPSETP